MADTPRGRELHDIDEDRCWELLEAATLGRLVSVVDGRLHLVPVTYSVIDRSIVFRTVAGTRLDHAMNNPGAEGVFEIDDAGERVEGAWSVVVAGALEPVLSLVRVSELDRRAAPSWLLGDTGGSWVQLLPFKVTGRERSAA